MIYTLSKLPYTPLYGIQSVICKMFNCSKRGLDAKSLDLLLFTVFIYSGRVVIDPDSTIIITPQTHSARSDMGRIVVARGATENFRLAFELRPL
jgi:hypothetical protein